MRGSEFREIRRRLHLSEARFAELLGYTGKPKNNQTRIQEYERDKKRIPLYIARLAWLIGEIDNAYAHWGLLPSIVNADGTINFPEWEGYGGDDGNAES